MWGAIFPGQGSQSVGMGRFLFDEFAAARQLFEEASDTLKQDFKKLCFEGPESELQLTENTQPALLLVSTVTYRVISENLPFKVNMASGHSVGEYAALVASGVLRFGEALLAVRRRGQAMQAAVPVGQGAMAAILGMTDEQVMQLCTSLTSSLAGSGKSVCLEPANFNCPGQVVISGSADSMLALKDLATPAWLEQVFGANPPRLKMIPLNVSAPFHCSLMKPAEVVMAEVLQGMSFNAPQFPVVQNLKAESTSDPNLIREWLTGQISGTVRWTQCQQKLNLHCQQFVEMGGGKVLAGLGKKIDPTKAIHNINSLDDFRTLEQNLKRLETENAQ